MTRRGLLLILLLSLLAWPALRGAAAPNPAAPDLAASCDAAIRQAMAAVRQPGDSLACEWRLPPLKSLPAQAAVEAKPLQIKPRGTCTIELRILEQGQCLRRLTVPVRLRRWEKLPVARRDLERDRVLAAEDLELRWLETTQLAESDLPPLSEVLGRRLTRFLLEGRPIAARQLTWEPDIKRGEPLTLCVVSGGVTVSAAAEALEDGRVGQWLHVRLAENGKRFSARLTAKGQAVVEVTG